jgi:SAM-dependent methyltransferase
MEPDFLRDTRASYDAVAVRYAEWLRDELAAKPFDRAILAAFAELVLAAGLGPVADIGCGAGRVTAHLKGLGLTAFGIDLSPQMVAEAFAEFYRVLLPGGYALLAFQVGHEPRHVTQALGHSISVDLYQRQPDDVASMLARVGLVVRARLIREPDDEGDFTERTQQAFLLARKS